MELKYNTYSKYLKNKYGEKVYKIPINIPASCPNRDGTLGKNGCIFCGEQGTGYENFSSSVAVSNQIEQSMELINKKYKAKKFIAYFQNFSNTYISFEYFKKYILESCNRDIVEIAISTRPDCISEKHLEFLYEVKKDKGIEISIELGLQTVNYHTLQKLNRGHGLAEFINAVLKIQKYNFEICVHMILDLPWDTIEDVIESSKVISSLEIKQVKIHSLYIVKNTLLEQMYKNNEIQLLDKADYIERVIKFLEYLSPQIVIQRLIGRAPKEDTVLVNWNTSWWRIKSEIDELMEKRKTFQGKNFNYLCGKSL